MNESYKSFVAFCAGAIVITGLLIVTGSTPSHQLKKDRQDAIAHGAAHWAVNTNGVVTFEWNEK